MWKGNRHQETSGVLYSIWVVFGKTAFAPQNMCGKSVCHMGLGCVLKYPHAIPWDWDGTVTIGLAVCRCVEREREPDVCGKVHGYVFSDS